MSRLINPWVQHDGPTSPYAGGTVYFGLPNQDPIGNPKAPFSDSALQVPIGESQTLDSKGMYQTAIFLKGAYSMSLFDSNNNFVRTDPDVRGAITSGDGSVISFSTLLEAVQSVGIGDGDTLNIAERTTGNGGGAMWLVVLTSSVTPNTFNIVISTGNALLSLVLRLTEIINPVQWGSVLDGSTVNTLSNQAALKYAEDNNLSIFFPPGGGNVTERLDVKVGGIKIYGDHSHMIQRYESVVLGSGGAGSTKAWPVFMIFRDADHTEVTGFKFTADSTVATIQAGLGVDWFSYISFIVSHNAANTWIHHNEFAGAQDRAIFFHGGNFAKIHNNTFGTMGMIMHVGFAQNQNFWDTGANDQSTWFSPVSPNVYSNDFDSYAGALTSVLFMTGAINITVKDNKITGMNQAGASGIRIYTNDFGLTDNSGTPQLIMGGEVSGNTVEGLFENGMILNGFSSTASSQIHQLRLEVHGNTFTGTGNGFNLERVNFTNIHDNQVCVTKSPLLMTRDITKTHIDKNNLEGTVAGNNTVTIWTGSTLTFDNSTIDDNEIVSPSGDKHVMTATATSFDNSSVSNNRVSIATTIAAPIPFNLTVVDSFLKFNGNMFTITGSTMVDRALFVIDGTADLEVNNNKVISSTVQIDRVDMSCTDLQFHGNEVPGAVIDATGKVYMGHNTLVLSTTSTTQPLKVSNALWLSMDGNFIESAPALAVPTVFIIDCTDSRLVHNRILGDSSVPLVRNDNSGEMNYWGNEQGNNGAGGVTFTTTGSATAVAETGQ